MARWPTTRRRRRRGSRLAGLIMVALVVGTAAAAYAWRHELTGPGVITTPDLGEPARDTAPLSPDLYGTTSVARPWGRLVDTPDSLGPIVLLIAPGSGPIDGWAGLQALLERHGLASAATADPSEAFWVELERLAGEGRRPIRAILVGSAMDRLDAPRLARLARQPVVVVAPTVGADARPWWRRLLGKTETADMRLARLGPQVMLVTMRDDPTTPETAMARLVAGGTRVRHVTLDGGGVEPPPLHPDMLEWGEVVRFLQGRSEPNRIELAPEDDTMPGEAPTGAS